jgi:hypothetical protein
VSLAWQNNPDGTTTFFDPAQASQPLVGASLAAAVPVTPALAGAAVGGTVSLLGDIVKIAAPIAGAYFGGPIGATIAGGIAGSFGGSAQPGSGAQVASMAALPSIGTVGTVGGAVARAGVAGARAIIASARYYCAKYPGWCISIGGLGAVQGMVQNGQLPVHRRRRARGISASEFRGFRKVHKVLSGFCAPKMRIRRRK